MGAWHINQERLFQGGVVLSLSRVDGHFKFLRPAQRDQEIIFSVPEEITLPLYPQRAASLLRWHLDGNS